MKNMIRSHFLTFAALASGALALVLRWALYALAVDEKGLLPVVHPLEALLWVLTAAAAAFLIFRVRKLDGSNRYTDNFGPSLPALAGAWAMAAGILATVLTADAAYASPMSLLWKVTGFLSVPALVLTGLARKQGKRPLFLFHFVVCVHFALHMVSRYQSWSGNPQLQDYFYSLFGIVLLMLFAFYQAAFDVGSGKRRMQLAIGLLAAYCCLAALAHTECPALYLGGGVWTLTGLCTQSPVPRRQKQEAPAQDKE